MWKLVVLTTLLAVAWARSPPAARTPDDDLAEIWRDVRNLEHGHMNVVIHGHGARGRGHGHGSHEDHDHSDEEHDDDSHEHHGEHHDADHDDEHGTDTHIHILAGGQGAVDMYHGNPIPGADRIPVEYVHGVCHMVGGTQQISGTVYMRQRFMGKSAVTMDFDLHGFDHSQGHMHTFSVNRYGNTDEQCQHVGHVFTPPHRMGYGDGYRHGEFHDDHDSHDHAHDDHAHDEHGDHEHMDHHEDGHHDDHHDDHDDDHHDHGGEEHHDMHHDDDHADHEGHLTEGILGELHCDDNGDLHLEGQEFNTVTIIGFHSIIGRSIVISNSDDDSILGCCQIGWSDGEHFHDAEVPWLEGEMEDLEN